MTDPNIDSKIDKIIFRCFEQGHYWGELTGYEPDDASKPEPPENPIDRTQAVKAIQALVLQAEKAGRRSSRRTSRSAETKLGKGKP